MKKIMIGSFGAVVEQTENACRYLARDIWDWLSLPYCHAKRLGRR